VSVYTAYPNEPRRKMRPHELALIQASRSELSVEGLADWDVTDMDGGGMMSIEVHPAPRSLRKVSTLQARRRARIQTASP